MARCTRISKYKALAFALTFLSYMTYTATRLPYSITKSSLDPHVDDDDNDNSNTNMTAIAPRVIQLSSQLKDTTDEGGWSPFNDKDNGLLYLGILDTCFLASYAIFLFFSGHIGDRVDLRIFMSVGMLGAGASVLLFGMAKPWSIHSLPYFIFCNVLAGMFQSTGWPANVTILARWFGHKKRGTIMGVWNAHSSIGNIGGKLIANACLAIGWSAAFIIPGIVCIGMGVVMFLFLKPEPEHVLTEEELRALHADAGEHIVDPEKVTVNSSHGSNSSESDPLQPKLREREVKEPVEVVADEEEEAEAKEKHLSFWQILLVPGVIPNSLCLFFNKLVVYAFIGWLPTFLKQLHYSTSMSNNLSTVFDMGGVLGGIIAGYIGDRLGSRGVVSFVLLLTTVPVLWVYSAIAGTSIVVNIFLMIALGILVNGPYTVISGVVAADLGTHPSLKGNKSAMSTVTGIIDGTGSLGSAIQGVLIGWLHDRFSWDAVFYFLMISCFCSAACIARIVWRELFGQKRTLETPPTPIAPGYHVLSADALIGSGPSSSASSQADVPPTIDDDLGPREH